MSRSAKLGLASSFLLCSSLKAAPGVKADPCAPYLVARKRLTTELGGRTVASYVAAGVAAREKLALNLETFGANEASVEALGKLPESTKPLVVAGSKLVRIDRAYQEAKTQYDRLKKAQSSLPCLKKSPFEVYVKAIPFAQNEAAALAKTPTAAFEKVYAKTAVEASAIAGLKPKAGDPAEAIALAGGLTKALAPLAFARTNVPKIGKAYGALLATYAPMKGGEKTFLKTVNAGFDAVEARSKALKAALPKHEAMVASLLDALAKHAKSRGELARKNAEALAEDLSLSPSVVVESKQQGSDFSSAVDDLAQAYAKFAAAPALDASEKTRLADLAKGLKTLQETTKAYLASVAILEQARTAERSHDVAKRIPLYYFRDVQRVVNLLNPGIKAKEFLTSPPNLAELREGTTTAALDVDDALAGLADAQFAVIEKRRALSGVQGKLDEARKALTGFQEALRGRNVRTGQLQNDIERAGRQETDAKARLDDAKERLTAAQAERDAAATDEARAKGDRKIAAVKREIARAEATAKVAEERRIAAEEAQEADGAQRADAELDRDAAKTKVDGLETESKTLSDELATLESDLRTKALAVAAGRRKQTLAAEKESGGFATVRDNQPMFFAPGDPAKPDPTLRVDIAGFRDNSTIYLRGRELDVARVADLIAEIDRPAPQARLTLWELQVSFQDDRGGVGRKQQDELLGKMENLLTGTRRRTALMGSVLRDCVNAEVNRFATAFRSAHQTLVRGYDGFSTPGVPGNGDYGERLVRLHFYEPTVTERLGLPEGGVRSNFEADLALRNLPDPGAVTTLGESLLVLSMARPDSRVRIVKKFLGRMDAELGGDAYYGQKWFRHWYYEGSREKEKSPLKTADVLANSLRLLNVDAPTFGRNVGAPTTIQAELLQAIRRGIAQGMIHEVYRKEQAIKKGELEDKTTPTVRSDIRQALDLRYAYLAREFQLQPDQLRKIFEEPRRFERFAFQFPQALVNARIAAADDMIKRIVIAIEDDMERAFIRPALYELQAEMRAKRINVGLVQRTSVLATNRFPARVDTGATAQLAIDGQQDLLASAQQLAQLVVGAASQNPLALLGSLKSDPAEPAREIYGVTTGGLFSVTPVLDPSGQGLRFVFDHVQANRVRDPDGTVSPQLPRIERHSINTEVQLGAFELREFSRFQTNAQIGTPPHYWGGIPILNQIPVIRDIPLLGYFVRKGGRRATIQQSLVFGQTTIYPTVGDILNLATPLSNRAWLGGG